MEKVMTKKNILIISGFLSVIILAWDYIGNYHLCDLAAKNGSAGDCPFLLSDIELIFLPVLPFFIFSLITYKMRDEVYQSWFRFARWWIPLSVCSILIAPSYSSDWMFPVDKGRVAFLTSFVFVFVSIFLIAYKSFALRKKG